MTPATRGRKKNGFAILVTVASIMMVIPIVGLAIDAGFLYAVKARLSAATDAAAIAAGRSLSKGLTISEQETTAQNRARAFFEANFPAGYFNTIQRNTTVTVAETAYRTRTVFVETSAEVGLFFMRIFGRDSSTIRAQGRASRRDVNIMLVLDRSGSMDNSGSCQPMIEAAKEFVDKFANGRDRLGLVTFGMTYLLAFSPSQDFKPALPEIIDGIDCSGGTGTAQALWKGYEQLEAINEPSTLNLIVFFTDGLPNGITAAFPVKHRTDTRYGYGVSPYSSTSSAYSMEPSTCVDANGEKFDRRPWQSSRTYYAPNWNPNWNPQPKVGALAGAGSGTASTGYTFGVTYTEAASLTNHRETPIADSSGCQFAVSWSRVRRDIAYIPEQDIYGNSTRGYAGNPYEFTSGTYAGHIRPDRPVNIGIVSKNAADNAARRIRTDPDLPAVIYAIGLGEPNGGEPPDEDFMKRVANDPDSPAYDEDETTGLYVFAPDKGQLAQAFYRVASEILRISQ